MSTVSSLSHRAFYNLNSNKKIVLPAVSLVLSAVEPALRASAELGAWQLISPGNATGRVVVVAGLHEVQDDVRTVRFRN